MFGLMTGRPGPGVSCGSRPRAANYNGGFWHTVVWGGGAIITRAPDFPTCGSVRNAPEWWPAASIYDVYHETDFVELPRLEDGGVTYQCVGMMGSQYADGSAWKPAPKDSYVWFQLHYAPVGDLRTTRPRAALARVRVCRNAWALQEVLPFDADNAAPADGDYSATAYNHECTLVNLTLLGTSPSDHPSWGEEDTLYDMPAQTTAYRGNETRRTVVGPDHFALEFRSRVTHAFDSETETGGCRIYVWGPTSTAPTLTGWNNPEIAPGETLDWPVTMFCKTHFPMGMALRCEIDTHPDGSLREVQRFTRVGKIDLSTMRLIATDVESNVGNDAPSGRSRFARTSESAEAVDISDTWTFYNDLCIQTRYQPNVGFFNNSSWPPTGTNFVASAWRWSWAIIYSVRMDAGQAGTFLPQATVGPVFGGAIKTLADSTYRVRAGAHPIDGTNPDVEAGTDAWYPDTDPADESEVRVYTSAETYKHNTFNHGLWWPVTGSAARYLEAQTPGENSPEMSRVIQDFEYGRSHVEGCPLTIEAARQWDGTNDLIMAASAFQYANNFFFRWFDDLDKRLLGVSMSKLPESCSANEIAPVGIKWVPPKTTVSGVVPGFWARLPTAVAYDASYDALHPEIDDDPDRDV